MPDHDAPRESEADLPPPEAVAASPRPAGLALLRPEHLYKAVALFFLLAFLNESAQQVARVLLIVYAAGILAVAFNALVGKFPEHRRATTALLGVLILALVGVVLWFGGSALVSQVRGFSEQIPEFRQQLNEWGAWIREQTGLNVQLISQQTSGLVEDFFLGGGGQKVLSRARGVLEFLILPVLILFGALFAVGKPNERLLSPVLRAIPRERRPAFQRMFELLGVRILGWIEGTLLSMLIIGALSTIAFYLLGLDYALLLGVWSGLTEFIPLLGPWIGGLTAIIVAFLQDPQLALWTALVVFGIQQLESNLITPLVMAEVANVHPFVTLFAILLFGSLFGFLGVLLALPLVLLIWTVFQVLWVERAIDTDEDRIEPVVGE